MQIIEEARAFSKANSLGIVIEKGRELPLTDGEGIYMSMTRKHYIDMASVLKSRGEVIAATAERSDTPLKEAYSAGQIMSWRMSVIDIAAWFALDNPRFEKAKFYVACGY